MKVHVLWAVVALVAGLALGGWGLRADLHKAREELRVQQAKAGKGGKRSAELEGIRTMLRLPEGRDDTSEPHPKRSAAHSHSDSNTNTNAAAASQQPPSAPPATGPASPRKSMDEQIQQASELWNTRVALARSSFVSNVGLNKDQENQFDILVGAMNLRLGDSIEKWAVYLKAKQDLNPEDGIRIMKDLSEAMVLTYDELDRNMPPDWRNKAGENFQLFNFIDPEVARPLVDAEEILNKGTDSGARSEATPEHSVTLSLQ